MVRQVDYQKMYNSLRRNKNTVVNLEVSPPKSQTSKLRYEWVPGKPNQQFLNNKRQNNSRNFTVHNINSPFQSNCIDDSRNHSPSFTTLNSSLTNYSYGKAKNDSLKSSTIQSNNTSTDSTDSLPEKMNSYTVVNIEFTNQFDNNGQKKKIEPPLVEYKKINVVDQSYRKKYYNRTGKKYDLKTKDDHDYQNSESCSKSNEDVDDTNILKITKLVNGRLTNDYIDLEN